MSETPFMPTADLVETFQAISDDVFFVGRPDAGVVEYVGANCREILGYTAEDILARASLLAPALSPDETESPALGPFETEFSFEHPEGGRRWIRARSYPVDGPAGQGSRVAGVLRDVTAQRASEGHLRRSREDLLGILERMPEGILVTTPERILFANASLAGMLGLREAEVVGTPPDDYFHVQDRSWVLDRIVSRFTDRVEAEPVSDDADETQEVRMLREGGGWGTVAFTPVQAVQYEGETGVLCLVKDMTAEVRARTERDRARARYQSIFQNSPLGVLLIDAEGRVLEASPAVTRLLKTEDGQLEGRAVRDLLHRRDQDKIDLQLKALLEGDLSQFAQNTGLRTPHETHVPVRLHVSRAEGPGTDGRILVCLVEDTSERKALEQQLRTVARIESIGRLAGGIAHDFNNLVTVINGHTEMLLAETEEGDLHRADLQEILEAGERAAALTNQLLAFSRRTVQESRVLDLNEVVDGLRGILARTLGEDIRFQVEEGRLTRTVVADQSQLEQVILNLVVNARDAMPQGGTLTLRTRDWVMDQEFALSRPGAIPGDYLRLTVEDTGVGMDEEILNHIFEPFFTTKAPGVGTGLGLATVYGIIKQTRGYVDVESTPGEGTAFHVYLPASDFETDQEPDPVATPVEGGDETILLVEDEDAVRSLAQRVLGLQGYRVFTASNGEEGLKLAKQLVGDIDLLVTDVIMPVLGGRELAERLQEHQPGIRTLFISGYPDDALLRHGMKRGKVQLLYKPFTAGEFARRVRAILDRPAGS